MAYTLPADLSGTTPEVWARTVLRSHLRGAFWRNMIGREGSGKPIIQKTELLNKPGDLIHIGVTDPLSGTGYKGDDQLLIGNEEKISDSEIKCAPFLVRHAVRWNRRASKKSFLELRPEAKMRLGEWGMSVMDTQRFRFFVSDGSAGVDADGALATTADPLPVAGETYTPNVYIAGELANEDLIANATGLLTVRDLQVIKVTLEDQLAKPLMTVEGEEVYAVVVSPNAAFNLKRDSEYQSYVENARERAKTNPLFTGALAMIDGMVVFEHSRVPRFTNAHADTVDCMRGIAFGAEAFIEGLDEAVHSEEETIDYGLHKGISYEFAFQPRRALEQNSLQVVFSDQRTSS